jgi:hypothetical protein
MMASMAATPGSMPQVTTYYFKGQKMKTDNGNTATVIDFDAQTITTVNNTAQTYTVRSFSDVAAAANQTDVEANIDVKETGLKKVVNGFSASEVVMAMEFETPQAQQMGKMRMEVDMWVSPDVPGGGQVQEFYRRNAKRFPWAEMTSGGNAGMQKAMADMQRKMASVNGVRVEEVVRVKPPGGAASGTPQMSGAQSAQLAQARAKMEAMIAQGGPQAEAMKQALARMPGGAPAAGGSGPLIEITMDSSDFSSEAVPDSVFAIPAGYRKGN